LIERAYQQGEAAGLAVWTEDEAGPFPTLPYPGASWQPEGEPLRQPPEYFREGTAKLLNLFHPASGQVHMQGVTSSCNMVLHGWLQDELSAILAALPPPVEPLSAAANRAQWEQWQEGLTVRVALDGELPPLRMLLVLDNLAGHKTPSLQRWLVAQGILPLYTPLGGSWLNMAESVQRIVQRRALDGQYPQTPHEIMEWLEATARGWNADPTPFEWGGKRAARRARRRARRQALGGSGAWTRRRIRDRRPALQKWRSTCQVTH
jgi:DDE superfamily endonuclease